MVQRGHPVSVAGLLGYDVSLESTLRICHAWSVSVAGLLGYDVSRINHLQCCPMSLVSVAGLLGYDVSHEFQVVRRRADVFQLLAY